MRFPAEPRDTHRATVKVTSGLVSYVDLRCRDRNKDEQQPPEWRKERRTYVVTVGPMYRALFMRGGDTSLCGCSRYKDRREVERRLHHRALSPVDVCTSAGSRSNPVYLSCGYRKLPDLSRVGITDISQKSLFKQIGACLHPISRFVSGVPCERNRPVSAHEPGHGSLTLACIIALHVAPDSITIHLSHRRRTTVQKKRTSGLSSRVPVDSEKVQHNSEAAEKIQLCEKDDKVRRALSSERTI
ncbi:hypothetical protein G5I_00120 [Acromyrmex echinatior]|uniref:Uncharacterized protein n=1 Tax=Acromyrmex echinatior TaxID=103372 RepID=F4W415_ACREC|nr:hypothetical protein G5I_00120 [Acromyrmex echinatior]